MVLDGTHTRYRDDIRVMVHIAMVWAIPLIATTITTALRGGPLLLLPLPRQNRMVSPYMVYVVIYGIYGIYIYGIIYSVTIYCHCHYNAMVPPLPYNDHALLAWSCTILIVYLYYTYIIRILILHALLALEGLRLGLSSSKVLPLPALLVHDT